MLYSKLYIYIHIKKLINKCKKFYSLSKSIPSYYVKWRSLQFKLYSEIKLYNIKTEEHDLNSNDKSSFFKYINSKLKSNKPLSVLRSNLDGSIITNYSDSMECLSLQFNSVFNNNTSPVQNIPSIIFKNTFESFPLSPETIIKFLCFLPNKFNNSSDGLPKGVLKILSFELCEPLSIIYSRFLKEGYCPDLWKHSYITPIYKKGDPTLAENYIQISILPSSLITFEQILSNHLIYFLRDNNIINDYNQYGFLSGKSTDLQLLKCYRYIFKAKDNSKSSDIIYIDMAKPLTRCRIHYYSINYLILVYKEMSLNGLNITYLIEFKALKLITICLNPKR